MSEQTQDKKEVQRNMDVIFVLMGIIAILIIAFFVQEWSNNHLSSYAGIVTAVETSVTDNNCVVYFTNGTHTKAIKGTVNVIVGDKYSIVVDGLGNIRSLTLEN